MKEKFIKTTTQTGNPIAPTCNSDVRFLQYHQTETEFDFKTISYGPDQFIVDDFKYIETWEIFSADPQSNQVVLRCGFKIDWLSKPFGIWSLADSMIKSRVRESEKSLKTWFPAKANDFLNSQPKP
jgi:hypothetical protein